MRIDASGVPLELLRARLADDGDPPIRLDRDGGELLFTADTAETMLRARVFAALGDVGVEGPF